MDQYTLAKAKPMQGGRYKDLYEFRVNHLAETVQVTHGCAWERMVGEEQDNGSDVFEGRVMDLQEGRREYKRLMLLGYVLVNEDYALGGSR